MDERWTVRGGVGALRAAAARTAVAACDLGVPPDRQGEVELAVHEALANAFEHGHLGDPGLPIGVELARPDPGTVIVRIRDHARGGGWEPVASPEVPEEDERGRGRRLMHMLTDGIDVVVAAGATSVVLRWSRPVSSSGRPAGSEETTWRG
jgi:anti-sigma regulatory factor (Ser/Thr protein kinase)